MNPEVLERRALRVEQHPTVALYLFTLAAEEIDRVADVARISRDQAGKLLGYQRPEKRNHVRQILQYLDSDEVLFPNGLILAMPPSVRFKSSRGPGASDGLATAGTLEIPIAVDDDQPRPAWIVDGQQRSLALARTKNRRLPVPVAGFVAEGLDLQRDQFLRVNTVSPLPVNLVTELLPQIVAPPSSRMAARRLPSALVDMLNQDPDSAFYGLIKRASTEVDDRRDTPVTDNSLVEAFRESLESPSGLLFAYRNIAANTTDTEEIRHLLLIYWNAVKTVFSDAWGRPPSESRLMGGVGIRAMGRLMERVMVHIDLASKHAQADAERELARIVPLCHWTSGTWDEIGLPWNEVQNTPRHISTLSNYLVRQYVTARTAGR